jgi:SAM-dependent methyltransferase
MPDRTRSSFVAAEDVPTSARTPFGRAPRFLEPGGHTAYGGTIDYRLGKLADRGLIHGSWLDVGCAQGYWTVELNYRGAECVIGIEPVEALIAEARDRPYPASVSYDVGEAEALPFTDERFDGVLMNEVLEHVRDEAATLSEIARVLRPGGHLALFGPNRWFPFEGHGARLNEPTSLLSNPVPLMPWLPSRVTRQFATARNYWPHQLSRLVSDAGLTVVEQTWALAQFDRYRWMPRAMIPAYRQRIGRIERSPFCRFLAVSTLLIARAGD